MENKTKGKITESQIAWTVYNNTYVYALIITIAHSEGKLTVEFYLTLASEISRISKILKIFEAKEIKDLEGCEVLLFFDGDNFLIGVGNTAGAVVPRLWKPAIFDQKNFIEMAEKVYAAERLIQEIGGSVEYGI